MGVSFQIVTFLLEQIHLEYLQKPAGLQLREPWKLLRRCRSADALLQAALLSLTPASSLGKLKCCLKDSEVFHFLPMKGRALTLIPLLAASEQTAAPRPTLGTRVGSQSGGSTPAYDYSHKF